MNALYKKWGAFSDNYSIPVVNKLVSLSRLLFNGMVMTNPNSNLSKNHFHEIFECTKYPLEHGCVFV